MSAIPETEEVDIAKTRARQRFFEEVSKPEEEISILQAAVYMAQEEYPSLSLETVEQQLDQMGEAIKAKLPEERYPMRVLNAVNDYLYDTCGFRGNSGDYYDPRNSFINDVLERRIGIPISLSLVYMEMCKRIDFPMEGVNLPGHFIIRPTPSEQVGTEDLQIFIDPFNKGEVLFYEDCRNILAQVYEGPAQDLVMTPDMLATAGPKAMLVRMLSNLKNTYLKKNDIHRALAACERILLVDPSASAERRDLGLIYYKLRSWERCRNSLEMYLALEPNAWDSDVGVGRMISTSARSRS